MIISSCNLLKMNSIRGFSRFLKNFIQSVMAWMNFQNNYFRSHLLYEALLSQNNSKCMLSSLSNRAIFFLEYFILKNHRKKHVPSFSLSWWEGITSLLSIMFSCLRFRRHTSKTFLYWRNLKDFDLFKATHFQF